MSAARHADRADREWMEKALHDVSSPLSTLRGQLELGQMLGDEASLRGAVEAALLECGRVFTRLQAMREQMLAAEESGR